MTGRILVWRPPEVLEFTWSNEHAPNSIVRYDLTREGDGARKIFTHRGGPYASGALMLPGWRVYFARLGSALEDLRPFPPRPSWREMQTIYVERYNLHDVALEPRPPRGP